MNSIWNNNLASFKKRFPGLFDLYSSAINEFSSIIDAVKGDDFFSEMNRNFGSLWEISAAKNGEATATENGIRLHSSYNPSREAVQAIATANGTSPNDAKTGMADSKSSLSSSYGIFCGFGLGYTVIEFAKQFPSGAILAIEPDPVRFFLAMALVDWTPVFRVEKCIIALSCPLDQFIPLAESFGISLDKAYLFYNPAFMKHAEDYFSAIKKLVQRNLNKINLNENTKRKFGKIWERNARMNLKWAEKCDGVCVYKDAAKLKPDFWDFSDRKSHYRLDDGGEAISADSSAAVSFLADSPSDSDEIPPFLLIAAGPSLEKMLPKLPELKSKMITVCVDTALKAVLRAGVEPDFIVLTDPQFWAYMHIAGLESPSSVLIADAVSYPAVFRFPCKKIVISSSPFPLPDEYKSAYAKMGDLGSGGSVATVAWNFCEYCGAKEIYTVGLDLSFPKKQTHIKGSSFEQSVHTTSNRIVTAEKRTSDVLFGADISKAHDYNGNEVLTDSRMKMFAWWFESRIAASPHVKTQTLCAESMVIPGIAYR